MSAGVPQQARQTWFPDEDLIAYVREMYGAMMAERVSDMFVLDPMNETGFCNSVRRSLTLEIERRARV